MMRESRSKVQGGDRGTARKRTTLQPTWGQAAAPGDVRQGCGGGEKRAKVAVGQRPRTWHKGGSIRLCADIMAMSSEHPTHWFERVKCGASLLGANETERCSVVIVKTGRKS